MYVFAWNNNTTTANNNNSDNNDSDNNNNITASGAVVHLRQITQPAHVRSRRLTTSGGADDSLQDWWGAKCVALHHSSSRAAGRLPDGPPAL